MKTILTATIFATALLFGCDKGEGEKKPEPDPSVAATAANTTTQAPANAVPGAGDTNTATAAPRPALDTISEADLSTPADFEEEADKTIDAKNYKTELASLDTEIGKE